MDAGDPQALGRLAHSANGAASALGAQALSAAALALEQACAHAGDPQSLQALGARLEAAWTDAADAARRYLATWPADGTEPGEAHE
jgi:HPt (histidine-containing phosphotransfer) domain-containing protein